MPKGGYRKPGNPAPVSGPGALSRRTDGGPVQGAMEIPANGKYGERKALQEMQTAAPMQGNPIPNVPKPTVQAPKAQVTNLFAPTQRPDEPVTAGSTVGPGFTPQQQLPERFAMLNKYMPALQQLEDAKDTPETFKLFMNTVRNLASEG